MNNSKSFFTRCLYYHGLSGVINNTIQINNNRKSIKVKYKSIIWYELYVYAKINAFSNWWRNTMEQWDFIGIGDFLILKINKLIMSFRLSYDLTSKHRYYYRQILPRRLFWAFWICRKNNKCYILRGLFI